MSEEEGSAVAEWYILHAFYGGASSAPPLTVEAAKNCVATHKPAPCTFVPQITRSGTYITQEPESMWCIAEICG